MSLQLGLVLVAYWALVAADGAEAGGDFNAVFASVFETVGASGSSGSEAKKLYLHLKDDDGTFYENGTLGSRVFCQNTYTRQPYVANGYIGARIPNVGLGFSLDTFNMWSDPEVPGSLNNGWPLREQRYSGAYVSDFYCLQEKLNSTNFPELDEHGYTTVISSIPQWTNLQFSIQNGSRWFNATEVQVEDATSYSQNLSLKDGIVATELDWLGGLLTVRSEIICHKKIMPLAIISLSIKLNSDLLIDADELDIEIHDILDFNTSRRTVLRDSGFDEKNQGIHLTVEPENVPYSDTVIYSTASVEHGEELFIPNIKLSTNEKVAQSCKVKLSFDNPSLTIRKYVGVVSSEYFSGYQKNISNLDFAKQIAIQSKGHYDDLLSAHRNAWAQLYDGAQIEIPSDDFLEMTARSSMYHLLANTRTANKSDARGLPVPVSGLSADSYGGMVFWDSDIWMQPALLPFAPKVALQISNYRNVTQHEAVSNARRNGFPGAVYPWTSGRFANCTSTGPCFDYEYHVNIDIALASFQVYLHGAKGIDDDYLRYTTWPIIKNAAVFFASFVKYNETLDIYETHNLTDPDEFANHISNGAFTNAGIKMLLKWATEIGLHLEEDIDEKWIDVSQKICIPKAPSNITLEYSGMNSSVESKQADVVLLIYPLNYIDKEWHKNSIKDLYFYSERQSASGPAMTSPVYASAAAALLDYGSSSQSHLYKSVQPFLRGPFAQFSEQANDDFLTNGLTQPAFPFLTANGGFLQSILYGLTGIRFSYAIDPKTKKITRKLKFVPTDLPLLPGGIAIKNFKYMNQVLDIIIDDCHGTIFHKMGDTPITVEAPEKTAVTDKEYKAYSFSSAQNSNLDSYMHTLYPGEKLILPLLKPMKNIDGNIVESKEAANLTEGVPGDVAYSAFDGNNYTHWQSFRKNETAILMIDLGKNNPQIIKSGSILWGQNPARNISIAVLPGIFELNNLINEKLHDKAALLKECIKASEGNCRLNLSFVPVLQDLKIKPSEQFLNSTDINLLPGNSTEFTIDEKHVNHTDSHGGSMLTRFVVFSMEGAYGDESDSQGATLKELVLRS